MHPKRHTPHVALVASGCMASVGILGSHLAGDFFLGVDLLVLSMLVNFLFMCLSVLSLDRRNPALARRIEVFRRPAIHRPLALTGAVTLTGFLAIHVWKDLNSDVAVWYFRSTPVWLAVMALAAIVFWREMKALERSGADVEAIFSTLPPE